MKKRQAMALIVTLLALSCASQGGSLVQSAIEADEVSLAVSAAHDDADELDAVAMKILASGIRDPRTRELAIELAMRSRSRARPLIEELAYGSQDALARISARAALHAQGAVGYEQSLLDALASGDGQVRAAALGGLVATRVEPAFFEEHSRDSCPEARLVVVRALVGRDEPWSADLLLEVAGTDPDPSLRVAALGGLSAGDPAHLPVLVDALHAALIPERVTAARVLGRSEPGMQAALATGVLKAPPTPEGIQLAATALASGNAVDEAAAYIEGVLADEREGMRDAALVALAGAGASFEGARALSADPSPAVRLSWCRYARVVGLSDVAERVSILSGILDVRDDLGPAVALAEEGSYPDVRARVWWALASGSESQKRYVLAHSTRPFDDPSLAISGMTDPDDGVRLHAACAWLTR